MKNAEHYPLNVPAGVVTTAKSRVRDAEVNLQIKPDRSDSQQPHPLYSSRDAANYLGIAGGTLEIWRCTKRHQIPFIRVGRLIKYRKVDLDAWLDAQTVPFG
jgi:excisionase family DNA binding protein